MKSNTETLIEWASNAQKLADRSQDLIVVQTLTGRVFGCSLILRRPQGLTTRADLCHLGTQAHKEADRGWMRGNWLNQPFQAGIGDLLMDAADLLPWPP